jgi:branched-chain amino acid transport system ATP-binding protein
MLSRKREYLYGYSHILQGVSLEVRQGEIVVLLGRNGVGKTTTMKTIMGIQPPKTGKVVFMGENIAGLPPYRIAQRGISLIPEDRRVIPGLTVYETPLGSLVRTKAKDRWAVRNGLHYFPALRNARSRMLANFPAASSKC